MRRTSLSKNNHRKNRSLSPGMATRPKKILNYGGIILLVGVLVAALGTFIYFLPGMVTAEWGDEPVLVIGNRKVGEGLVHPGDREIYINLQTLKEEIDPHLYWDEEEETAIVTTEERVIHLHSEELESEINLRPVELEFPLRQKDDELYYLPLLFLTDFYEIYVDYIEDTNTVVIDNVEDEAREGILTEDAISLRVGPSMREPVLEVLQKGETLRLEDEGGEEDGWILARAESGKVGYLQEDYVRREGEYEFPDSALAGEEKEEEELEEEKAEKKLPEHPFVMVWEDYHSPPNIEQIGEMPSLEVVSPTWFHVNDKEGNIHNIAEPEYVDWAHERGYKVWGLVTNSFDPDLTAEVLTSSSLRRKVIDQLIVYANLYDLDGINLDFENFHVDYRDYYTQFVRELAPLCREEGLVLSVDVSMITQNEYWSLAYDREALGEIVDYVMLMAYDEHWGASPVAGSVSSLPWVEEGLQEVLEKVPADKLVLGVPFYARKWTIEEGDDGEEEVSSRAFSMGRIEDIIEERDFEIEWDEDARQNLAVYEDDDKTYKIWLEDADSMKQRVELVNEYDLAGIAAWRRGFEKPEIWELIQDNLEQ